MSSGSCIGCRSSWDQQSCPDVPIGTIQQCCYRRWLHGDIASYQAGIELQITIAREKRQYAIVVNHSINGITASIFVTIRREREAVGNFKNALVIEAQKLTGYIARVRFATVFNDFQHDLALQAQISQRFANIWFNSFLQDRRVGQLAKAPRQAEQLFPLRFNKVNQLLCQQTYKILHRYFSIPATSSVPLPLPKKQRHWAKKPPNPGNPRFLDLCTLHRVKQISFKTKNTFYPFYYRPLNAIGSKPSCKLKILSALLVYDQKETRILLHLTLE